MKQEEFNEIIARVKAASKEVTELESLIEGLHRADSAALKRVLHEEVDELKNKACMLNLWIGK